MSGPNRQDESGSTGVFFGYTLLTIGWLIAATAGLCTTVVVGLGLTSLTTANILDYAPIPLLFGGIPILIGIGMIFLGRFLVRTGKVQQNNPPPGQTDSNQIKTDDTIR
jgi:hypothetical protein